LKAGNAIAALKDQLKPEAVVKRAGRTYNMNATLLVPGDRIILAAGAAVPADCTLCEGKPLQVDQAALTGESLPVTMYPGDVPKMGSTITRGESEAIVTGTGAETFFGKTAALIEGVDELGHFEKVLREIMWMLVGAGCIVTGIVHRLPARSRQLLPRRPLLLRRPPHCQHPHRHARRVRHHTRHRLRRAGCREGHRGAH